MASCYKQAGIKRRSVQTAVLVAPVQAPLTPGRSYDRGVGINPASTGHVNVIRADQINHDSTVAVNSDSTDRICRV